MCRPYYHVIALATMHGCAHVSCLYSNRATTTCWLLMSCPFNTTMPPYAVCYRPGADTLFAMARVVHTWYSCIDVLPSSVAVIEVLFEVACFEVSHPPICHVPCMYIVVCSGGRGVVVVVYVYSVGACVLCCLFVVVTGVVCCQGLLSSAMWHVSRRR